MGEGKLTSYAVFHGFRPEARCLRSSCATIRHRRQRLLLLNMPGKIISLSVEMYGSG